jgi:hypothetical protein
VSVRRRARLGRRPPFRGWVGGDDKGPWVHVIGPREPTGEALEAVLELRDAVIAVQMRAELEAGRWEDDGGPSEPAGTHRTYSLVMGRQGGRRPVVPRRPS